MEKGKCEYIERMMRFISEEDKTNIDYFYIESLNRDYKKISEDGDISTLLESDDMSHSEMDYLLNYSGYNYKHINAVLRGTWNYEENGNASNMDEYRELAFNLQKVIMNNFTVLNDNIMTYRGVDLSYFKQYGIESLEDLKSLEGNFMLDRGFVSTSLKEDRSFFQMDNDIGLNYNVKIEYMVPCEFRDGVHLDKGATYSPNQEEFLINSANLSRVSSVTINDDNTAVVRATLIPKELYDDYYKNRACEQEQK